MQYLRDKYENLDLIMRIWNIFCWENILEIGFVSHSERVKFNKILKAKIWHKLFIPYIN